MTGIHFSLLHWFTPKCPQQPKLGQAKAGSQQLHPGLPCGWQGLSSAAFPGGFAGSWIRSRVVGTRAGPLLGDVTLQAAATVTDPSIVSLTLLAPDVKWLV